MRILLVIILLTVSGCTTSPFMISHSPHVVMNEVDPGDWVDIITLDGEYAGFWVTEVTETKIAGAEGMRLQGLKHDIAYSEIHELYVQRFDMMAKNVDMSSGLYRLSRRAPASIRR